MALSKSVEIDNIGINADYWRIVQININFDNNDAVTTVQLYKNQQARLDGKSPTSQQVQKEFSTRLLDKQVKVNDKVYTIRQVLLHIGYTALKEWAVQEAAKTEKKDNEVAQFSDAVDVV